MRTRDLSVHTPRMIWKHRLFNIKARHTQKGRQKTTAQRNRRPQQRLCQHASPTAMRAATCKTSHMSATSRLFPLLAVDVLWSPLCVRGAVRVLRRALRSRNGGGADQPKHRRRLDAAQLPPGSRCSHTSEGGRHTTSAEARLQSVRNCVLVDLSVPVGSHRPQRASCCRVHRPLASHAPAARDSYLHLTGLPLLKQQHRTTSFGALCFGLLLAVAPALPRPLLIRSWPQPS